MILRQDGTDMGDNESDDDASEEDHSVEAFFCGYKLCPKPYLEG